MTGDKMRTNLGQMITEIQRAAGGMSTPDLRSEIEVGMEVLKDDIARVRGLLPGEPVMTRIDVTSDFMITVITVALMTSELATRPADPLPPVEVSAN
jgi:hypothetical protein